MGNWEPVVSVEVWEQANARLDAQKATQPWRRKHLLSGILRCGLCGAKMYVRPRSDGNPRFVCPSPASGGCGRLARKSEPLNIQVCELVARRLDLLHAIPAPEPILTVDRTSPIRERIAELQARYVDGTISGEIFYATLPQLEQRLAAAVKETRKATVPIPVGKLRDTWLDPKASLSQRVAVLADLITAIEVLPVKYPRHREKELRVFWAGEGSTAGEPSRR
jgi:site-specific DNA recombinase